MTRSFHMGRGLEIERKFLVKSLPRGWKNFPNSRIVQGYFPLAGEDLEIRLRHQDSCWCLTFKGGSGRARLEEEIELRKGQFERLWPWTGGARLSKTRYKIRFAGRTIELDIYHGVLRGLATAEVEFKSRRESEAFQPPVWFGREITGNPRFANATLARRKRPV